MTTNVRDSVRAPQASESPRGRVAANERIPIDDLTRMWVVNEGSVEVFAVRTLDGEPIGPRRWLFTAVTGAALFAIPTVEHDPLMLVAVAATDGEIEEFQLDEVRAAASLSGETRAWVAGLMDSWLEALGGVVARFEQAQITDVIAQGQTITCDSDRRVGATSAVVWVRHLRGHSWFAGSGGMIALRDSTGPFPLAAGSWILTRAPVELTTSTTVAWLEQSTDWSEFDFFRVLFSNWLSASGQSAESTERVRRLRRAAANRQMKDRAIAELMGTITSGAAPEGQPPSRGNALLDACRAIGRCDGIEFLAPAEWEVDDGIRNPLDAICVASRVRSRRVALKGEWWLRDSGSILCRYKEEGVPLAALRDRHGRYELQNPAQRSRVAMTGDLVDSLEPFGEVFYRPLPDTPVTTATLVRFVLSGMSGSIWNIALIALLAGALGLFMPIATGFVFDQVIPSNMRGQLVQVFIGLTIAAISAEAFELVRAFTVLRLNGRSATAMQAAVFDRLLQLPAPFFQRFTIGDLVSRIGGVSHVRQLLSSGAVTALLGGLTGFLNFALLFYFSPALAWVVGLFAFVTCATIMLLSWRAKRLQDRIQDIAGKLAGLVFQLVTGIAKLRVAGAEDRALAMWARQYVEEVRLENRAADANGLVILLTNALPLLASIVTFGVVGALMETTSSLDVATFIAFNSAMGAFLAATIAMSTTVVNMVQIIPLMKRASVILMETPEVTSSRPSPGRLSGRIEGRNLSFRYKPDLPLVLDNVSFFAEPGEFVAFVGPSGSGKSTTLRLLLGFEAPETGAVYFDGQDLATIDVGAVRRQMGVVLQGSRLMAGDIFTNIIGSSPLTLDDAWEAAEMAGFADDVRDMPMKMHTVISEGGSTLSGGQRQRLLIARALVHKPRIILFDEATSALDNRTQKVVTESLGRMHATRIVIAHRLSTIQHADRVYVIEDGKVVEWGAPDELFKQGGVFARLAARQLA